MLGTNAEPCQQTCCSRDGPNTGTQVTFNWTGFWSAMGSNLTFQSRNVLSKKMMSAAPVAANSTNNGRPAVAAKPLDNMNLFAIIQILSFFLLAPITLVREGLALTPSALSSLVGAGRKSTGESSCLQGWHF
jgi:hypothetical protein